MPGSPKRRRSWGTKRHECGNKDHRPRPRGRHPRCPPGLGERGGDPFVLYLARHTAGDWGEVPPEDACANDEALLVGERLLSAYRLRASTKLWIITEADRSSTCILLPEEY